jgi:hypothetical protein
MQPTAMMEAITEDTKSIKDSTTMIIKYTQRAVAELNPRLKHAHVASDRAAGPQTNGADK